MQDTLRETMDQERKARLHYATRAVVPILIEGDDSMTVQGSGTLFQKGGHHYLVTAAHVAEDLATHADKMGIPLHGAGGQKAEVWTFATGTLNTTGHSMNEEDVAVFQLQNPNAVNRLKGSGRVFLTEADVSLSGIGSFMVFGWPASQAVYDGATLRGEPIWMELSRTDVHQGKPTDIHFAWPERNVPKLNGISGAPIWVYSPASGTVWDPSKEMKLFGVQRSVLPGEYVRGTSWAVVDAIIRKM